ncbi:hypothetical protein AVEN_103687-1 [Araneus ventricosus]|uniref:Uncharacterized protein n=1 Tax=Araneus ventricosus TaxID=182803 RepID=A0A4Y2RCJ3_ARAVE|nr:hypothetical protein AVEN_103687-1 [Araneus ventricosus]
MPPSTNSGKLLTRLRTYFPRQLKSGQTYSRYLVQKSTWARPHTILLNKGWLWALGTRIIEDMQKFPQSYVMRTIAIGSFAIQYRLKMESSNDIDSDNELLE